MPRTTKADLTVSLEASLRRVEFLQEELRVERVHSESMNIALDTTQARVAVRDREIKALKAERGQSPRSRSPRRDAMSAAATHRVLNLVQRFERDHVIDEQRETIAKQQREIESLRRGDGPIGEVLLHNWGQTPGAMSDYTVNMLMAQKAPVSTTLDALRRTTSAAYDMCLWGGVSPYLVDDVRPVARMPPPE